MTAAANVPGTIWLKDYQAPAFAVRDVRMTLEFTETATWVDTILTVTRQPDADPQAPLVLHGVDLILESAQWNGRDLAESDWQRAGEQWRLAVSETGGTLVTRVRLDPDRNTALEGLYRSHGLYCTQCEAEGFRKITLYPDRPDVMAPFTVTLIGDKTRCPVLLANGNLVEQRDLGDGRHLATWHDPHPKPSYLFAVVAGDLACLQDHYVTASGREVLLEIYTAAVDQPKCHHAMASLKAAMRWDEQRYGREYDLDRYMIVAVSHFNMGAMENKGLNIFNTSCVLADAATTTDLGFQRVESVVAHEYFHNWTGNRVTCRDWFQLCLKEGFTVFRDQQFSADQLSPAVQRLEDVAFLQTHQFAEDASPLAHPVRPESFVEINNFYTLTVYEKGAEIARMLHTVLGEAGFRRGADLYFQRHDGQAVTVEDFLRALGDANGKPADAWLDSWLRWYRQPGTPTVQVQGEWLPAQGQYRVTMRQSQPVLAGYPSPRPLPVPVRVALLGEQGALTVSLHGQVGREHVLLLEAAEQSWLLDGVAEAPVLSLGRDFSAPVHFRSERTPEQLAHIARVDDNGYTRWAAIQALATSVLTQEPELQDTLVTALRSLWPALAVQDPALAVKLLELPGIGYLAEFLDQVDPLVLVQRRERLLQALAEALQPVCDGILAQDVMLRPYRYRSEDIAGRQLARQALDLLARVKPAQAADIAARWLSGAPHMTAQQSALTLLVHHRLAGADAALQAFHARWHHEALVLDQWFATQASRPGADALALADALISRPDFDWQTPNRVRAVVAQLTANNPLAFHREDGAGYHWLAQRIAHIDSLNPQLASRLCAAFGLWRKLVPTLSAHAGAALNGLADAELSADTRETVSKLLAG